MILGQSFSSIATATCAAVLLWGAAAPASVRAFERETVDGYPTRPLFWTTRTIPIHPAYDSSVDLPMDAVRDAILPAFETWELAGGCTDIRIEDAGAPGGLETNITGGDPDGENRIVFRETVWPDGVSAGVLALTTSVYVVRSGEIIDSDIDLNGVDYFWSATDVPGMIVNDVQNTVTHEIGHLLGFAHVDDPDATMYGSSPEGETSKRDLSPDDVAAVCTVYPEGEAGPDLGMRRSGLVGVTSCAVAGRGGRQAGALVPSLVALAWWASRAARRRRRPARE